MNTNRKPRHPGALIKRQYLEPLNMTVTELANILGVSRKTVSEIVNERASVTPNIALRFVNFLRYFCKFDIHNYYLF
ncbi:MAG: HigA family addiction module antitoxin [Sphaerospermopsis kisseleviana]